MRMAFIYKESLYNVSARSAGRARVDCEDDSILNFKLGVG